MFSDLEQAGESPIESVRSSFEELAVSSCGAAGKIKANSKQQTRKSSSAGVSTKTAVKQRVESDVVKKKAKKMVTGKQLTEKLEMHLRGHGDSFGYGPAGVIESEYRHEADFQEFKNLRLVLEALNERRAKDDSGSLSSLGKLIGYKTTEKARRKSY
eukprot:TRINITY_DN10491_c0_g1_i1.p1 TRINITY_DN10491_c0_g1~~TRINITY_DN10491_c0_g1_i1.p1  ORF type:complete len:169 (+),score=38.03 TRINITY_DN10491_c0_g1_i1:37-507(+)